jgi:MoaA/NifB/PqqE/SkfB family radical SAM enzyme
MMPTPTADNTDARSRNASLNLREMREGKEVLTSLPRYVMVELTQGCNLSCSMCRPASIGISERLMDRSLLAAVADVLFPTAELVDIRGWGESLLVRDIDAVIADVRRYGARCRVVTNLSLSRPATLDLLVESNAMVDVSLDSASQDVLAGVRTGARLSLIDRNLRHLADGFARRESGPDALRITATVQRSTVSGLADLVAYAADVGVAKVVLNEVTLAPGDPRALTGMDAEVDTALASAAENAERLGVELYAGTRLGTSAGLLKEVPWCIHPWSYVAVGYDGSIGYCDHLIGPMMGYACMGTFSRQGFQEVWNGEPWRALRRWHGAGHPPADGPFRACSACYAHRNVDFEDVFEPRLNRYRLRSAQGGTAR